VVQLEKKEELRKEEERKKRMLASMHAKQNGRNRDECCEKIFGGNLALAPLSSVKQFCPLQR